MTRPLNPGNTYFDVLEAFPEDGWYTTSRLVQQNLMAPSAYGSREDRSYQSKTQRLQAFLTDLVERGALERRKETGKLTEYRLTDRGKEARS